MKSLIVFVVMWSLSGCASLTETPGVTAPDVKGLAGRWQGWLVTEQGFTLIDLEIHDDGSFQVTGPRVRATGVLLVADGRLRFDGTGPWRGTLLPRGRGPDRVLRMERDDRLYRGTLHPVPRAG